MPKSLYNTNFYLIQYQNKSFKCLLLFWSVDTYIALINQTVNNSPATGKKKTGLIIINQWVTSECYTIKYNK